MLESTQVNNDRQCEGPQKFALASTERPQVVCNLLSTELDSSIRRIHHPSGAAPLGTPVRARFCMAVDFANSKLTHQQYKL
jgi:hypothetical protein